MKGNLMLQLKRGSPTILSVMGGVGLVLTTLSAVKATKEATERIKYDSRFKHDGDPYAYTKAEAFKSAWRCYIPTVVFGASTLACIFGANALNKKQQAALTSAYMLLNNTYKEFVKNDTDGAVRKAVIKDKSDFGDISPTNEKVLFYEFNHGELFERDVAEVLSAEYHFNKIFMSKGYACLNDFYELIGLPKSQVGETLCWTDRDGIPWVDFEHELVELEDGMECYIINLPELPIPDYIDSRKIQTTLWKGGKGSW
jgi:hypothetical protein